jgi:pimeloyl-ACP methyl ester carboxylesterase
MNTQVRCLLFVALAVAAVHVAGAGGVQDVGTLVPETVADDDSLPALEIVVRGRPARVHYRAFGFAPGAQVSRPVIFLLHGSLSDMRGYLKLAPTLAAHYPLFMWDMRGNGLSERVPPSELGFRWMAEEIEAVRRTVAPDSKIILIGYSWSGVFASIYAGTHRQHVHSLVLIEPPGLTGEYQNEAGGALNLFGPGYLGMAYLSEVVSARDHATVDFRSLAMLESGVRDFFVDADNPPHMPVWRVGGVAIAVWESSVVGPGGFVYDYTDGLEALRQPVLLLGSDHSPIGYEFQKKTNLREFPNVRIGLVENAGHRMVVEELDQVVAHITRFFLETSATEKEQ